MILTKAGVRDFVRARLGGNRISVELEDSDIDNAIDFAILGYLSVFGNSRYRIIAANATQNVHDLSSWEGIDNVISVTALSAIDQAYTNTGLGMYEIPGVPVGRLYDTAMQMRQLQETMANVRDLYGSTVDFNYDRVKKKLLIYSGDFNQISVQYTCTVEATFGKDDPSKAIDVIKYEHMFHFLKLCLAFAKETLSLVRRKYGGVPIPGGEMKLDGDALMSESIETVDKVMADFYSMSNTYIIAG